MTTALPPAAGRVGAGHGAASRDVSQDGGHPRLRERVNQLYTRALMPGLAHLYSGEEAVAVGIARP